SFLFTHASTPEVYPLPLHDALPISLLHVKVRGPEEKVPRLRSGRRVVSHQPVEQHQALGIARAVELRGAVAAAALLALDRQGLRSEEHTSELQSLTHLVCRLLLVKN